MTQITLTLTDEGNGTVNVTMTADRDINPDQYEWTKAEHLGALLYSIVEDEHQYRAVTNALVECGFATFRGSATH